MVTITYLEMKARSEFVPPRQTGPRFDLVRVEIPSPEFNRFFYVTVGAAYHWRDRLVWSDDDWWAHVNRAELETWVAYVSGAPAGYFELERQNGDIQLAYFGLLPAFVGQGLGGPLLAAAINRAWDAGASRVWVHTCTLDHPNALANYEARGFKVYRTEIAPAGPPG